jgi:hypothetical protein
MSIQEEIIKNVYLNCLVVTISMEKITASIKDIEHLSEADRKRIQAFIEVVIARTKGIEEVIKGDGFIV